jgi:KaiC/GvpD/RAD55 family RecA-like ATPase
MAMRAVSRKADEQAVADFLDGVPSAPAALVIEGDPGIGKTTLGLDAVDRARERGFTVLASRAAEAESVLASRAAEAESVLAYAALADLLADVDESVWADLPTPQRQSLDAALLRPGEDAAGSDARAVAAAFVAVLNRLATPRIAAGRRLPDVHRTDPQGSGIRLPGPRRRNAPRFG